MLYTMYTCRTLKYDLGPRWNYNNFVQYQKLVQFLRGNWNPIVFSLEVESIMSIAMNVWNKGQKKNGSCVSIKIHIIVMVYAIHQLYLKSSLTRIVNVHGFELNIAIEYTKKTS